MLRINIIRLGVLLAFSLMMGACDKGIGKDVKQIAGELMKSKAQQAAEDGCFQAAANEEVGRFKDYRALSPRVPETTDLGGGHYLVNVWYKVITLESPSANADNACVMGNMTCEVQGNQIVRAQRDTKLDSLCAWKHNPA